MRLNEEDIIFGQTVFHNPDSLRYFLAEIKHKHKDFFTEIGRSCDEFVRQHGIRENDFRRRRNAAQLFLHYACGKIAALYKANGNKIPAEIIPIFHEIKNDCDTIGKIEERFDFFCTVDRKWAEYFITYAHYEGFCQHGLGLVYAWAEAFLLAQKLEEKRAAASAEIAERTKSLHPDWISYISLDLPEGKKNIGEE